MTICVAASCADGSAVVVASDRMLSAPFLTVEFDHQDAKIDQINQTCVALSSGDALCVQDVLIGGWGAANQLQNPTIQVLAEQIKHQFCEVRKSRINDYILGPRGVDFDTFYQGGMIGRLPPDLAMLIDDAVQRQNLGTTILVGGVDSSGAHIYCISDPGVISCLDRLGYHAIGTGHRHALLKLVAEGQHFSSTINQTIFNVFSAKKVAELAPGVGQATTMRVIMNSGTTQVDQQILDQLVPLYEKKSRPQLPDVEKAIAELPFDHERDDDAEPKS